MNRRKYFGTDGIRGRVGEPPMTADFVLHLGWATGRVVRESGGREVLIGKDTRLSGYMLESALEAGLAAAGVNTHLVGPMPTPAIAHLTRTFRMAAGIVISASHNPFADNGVKLFGSDGRKLPDAVEEAIEACIEQPLVTVPPAQLGRASRIDDASGRYIEFCKGTIPFGSDFRGIKLVVDSAHGADYAIAPRVFRELGAEVISIGSEPDGLNINAGCGATATGQLAARVVAEQADAGIALDGDGDRVIMVDRNGQVIDGDVILLMLARARHEQGQLGGGVVGTQMSNLGLEKALEEIGIPFARSAVGDRFVLELLHANGWKLGGEASGHVVCLDRTTTGDGLVSALQVLACMLETGQALDSLAAGMQRYPQVLVNVPTARRVDPWSNDAVALAVEDAERELGENGRVLLRPSGTEPLIRVMVEGRSTTQVESLAERIAGAVRVAFGGPVADSPDPAPTRPSIGSGS